VAQGWKVNPTNRGTLVVFPDGGEARLAWRFSIQALGGQWAVWVDANTGATLSAAADSWTVDGWVYASNPLDGDVLSTHIPVVDEAMRLDGRNVWASQCIDWTIDPRPFGVRVCNEWTQSAKADPQGDFFALPAEGELDDPFAEVNAFYHAERFAQWFAARFGMRTADMQIFTGFPLTNAFYGDFDEDGARDLSFGVTDDGYNFAYDSDVVIHEFGHAIVRELAGGLSMRADHLGLDWTPGALNEGVADTFAMLMSPDGLLAESMARSDRWDVAIRDLEPDRVCPDDLASQVHKSGLVWGSLAWNLIDDPRIGPDITGELMVSAVSTWDAQIDWTTAAQSLMDSSTQLLADGWLNEETHDAVVAHVEATGTLGCERIVDLERVERSELTLLNLGLYKDYERIPAGIQFKHRLSGGKNQIEVRVSDFTGPAKGTGLALYARVDAPVEHATTRMEGLGLAHAIPTTFDAVFELDEENTVLTLSGDNVPGLRPGRVLHWSVASINRTRLPMDAVYLSLAMEADSVLADNDAEPDKSAGCQATTMPHWGTGLVVCLSFCFTVILRRRKYRPVS